MTARWVIFVHPDDMNVADAKAVAAEEGSEVISSPYVPRGQFLMAAGHLLESTFEDLRIRREDL